MPAMLDDPDSRTIYRTSGKPPYPDPNTGSSPPSLPSEVLPRRVTLRDRQTTATVIPFASKDQVPPSLLRYLADQLNKEIEGGDTYPMTDPMSYDKFANYWFQNFGAIMLLGSVARAEDVALLREAGGPGPGIANSSSGTDGNGDASHDPTATTATPMTSTSDPDATPGDWSKRCLGAFYIKPNYPGRSSHVCNAGFLVTDASRNRGVGRLMGESYLDWAPRLGYTYSVFNLVYETNVASCRIWDALGFKRIGRVKGCGNLRSYPGQLVDALIYGRDLVPGEFPEDLVSEERFDKIKFYLKFGKYPAGADRAEKSRLRSAATHYKLVGGERLMLKDKEVVPDPRRQYDIAREVHAVQHGGINKTTATIAEKYHWSRIKETVSDVIKNCVECKELGKTGPAGPAAVDVSGGVSIVPGAGRGRAAGTGGPVTAGGGSGSGSGSPITNASALPSKPAVATNAALREPGVDDDRAQQRTDCPSPASHLPVHRGADPTAAAYSYPSPEPNMAGGITPSHTLRDPSASPLPRHQRLPHHNPMLQDQPSHHQQHHQHHHGSHVVYQPIDPQMIDQPRHGHHDGTPYGHYAAHHHHQGSQSDHQTETDFQALLNATSESDHHGQVQEQDAGPGHNHSHHSPHHDQHHHHFQTAASVSENSGRTGMEVDAAAREREREREAVDLDLDMLIEQGDGMDDEESEPDPDDEDETMAGMAGTSEQLQRGSAGRHDGSISQDEVAERPGRGGGT